MALQPSIILSGQTPDFVNVLARSNEAAGQANAIKDQNMLRQAYQQDGPGIMAGEQSALNRLAQLSPQAAMGIQQGKQDFETGAINQSATRQRMGILDAQEKRAIQEHTASLGAQAAAQEAERVRQGLMQGVQLFQRGDLPGINKLLESVGEPPIASLEEFPAVAVRYQGVLEAMESVKGFNKPEEAPQPPAAIQALEYRAQAAGLRPGTAEYAQFMADGGSKQDGMRITQGPDGLVIEQGAAVDGGPKLGKPTEGQLAGAGYLQRMTGSEEIIRGLSEAGMNAIPIFKSMAIDTKLEGYALSAEEASLAQAQRDWVRAKLRKESGAVIADEEMASEIKTYFPLPGEGPEIIEQKRQARARAERQMQIGAGAAAPMAGELSAGPDAAGPTGPNPYQGLTDEAFGQIDIDNLSDAELRQLYEAKGIK